MKILVPILLLMLALVTPAFANTEDHTKSNESKMTSTEHRKAVDDRKAVDECVEAKIRAKLLDAGIVTKSTTTAFMVPGSAAIFTSTTPQIAYNSENGVVTLNGTVLSKDQEQRIVNLVDEIQGVQRVDSNLKFSEARASSATTSSRADEHSNMKSSDEANTGYRIPEGNNKQGETGSNIELENEELKADQSRQPVSDRELEKRIKKDLSELNLYDASTFRVNVENGEVSVTGTVLSRQDANKIMSIIWGMNGVKNVNSRLVSANGTTTFTNDVVDMSSQSK
jgi:osmotically-inducible protein OsmY